MKYLFLVITILVTACAATPSADTNEKRLAAVEISWKQTLITVDKNIGRMTPQQKTKIAEILTNANDAIKAARLALSIANEVEFSGKVSAVNSSINILRELLETLEETSYEPSIKRHYVARYVASRAESFSRTRLTFSPCGIRGTQRQHIRT